MSELRLITTIEQIELAAFKLVKSAIFFYGLWHLLDGQLHIREMLKKRSNAVKANLRLLGRFVNYVEDEDKKLKCSNHHILPIASPRLPEDEIHSKRELDSGSP